MTHFGLHYFRIPRFICFVSCVVLWLATCGLASDQREIAAPAIHWAAWGAEAFERAKTEDKLILLDLTAVWCHACHVMDETTYIDPAVVVLLNAEFIPVRVETDQHPDIAARYRHGGWPTTSVLLPSGEILFQANALTPEAMLEVLRTSDAFYRENKRDMAERVARIWEQVESAQRASRQPHGRIYQEMLPQILQMMKLEYDPVSGGFRDAPKFFEPEAIELAFSRHFWHRDPEWRHGWHYLPWISSCNCMIPSGAGFFVMPRKRIGHIRIMKSCFPSRRPTCSIIWRRIRSPASRSIARWLKRTIRYVMRFLADREQWGILCQPGCRRSKCRTACRRRYVRVEDFFALNESQRIGYRYSLCGPDGADRLERLDDQGCLSGFRRSWKIVQDAGVCPQNPPSGCTRNGINPAGAWRILFMTVIPRSSGCSPTRSFVADALIEAFLTTGSSRYLKQAETVIEDAIRLFGDSQGGGYFDRTPSSSSLGLLKFPHKDLPVNAALSLVFSDLFYLTQDPRYREKAEQRFCK